MAEMPFPASVAAVRELNFAAGFADDQLCPNTGEVCPYRSRVVELFGAPVDPGVDMELPDGMHNGDNGRKLGVRLAETQVVARLIGCEGINDENQCPVGEAIKQSSIRQSSAGKIIKRIFSL